MPSASHRRIWLGLQVVLVSSLSFIAPEPLPAAASDADGLLNLCQLDSLPEDIRSTLTRKFNAWKVQEPTDLSPRAREKWAATRPLTCPGIAVGHFQNEKDSAYALLLIPADHAYTGFRFAFFTQLTAGQRFFNFRVIERGDAAATDLFIRSVPTSTYAELNSNLHSHAGDCVQLAAAGEQEQPPDVYCWADEGYQKLQVNK